MPLTAERMDGRFPLVECAVCDLAGTPGYRQYGPALPYPLGAGDPEEAYLWILPAFWGMISCLPATFIAHYLLKMIDPNGVINRALEARFGFSDTVLSAFGSDRLDQDRKGIIVAQLLDRIHEPASNPNAWLFLIYPFMNSIGLPWALWGDEWAPEETIEGFPTWAYRFVMLNASCTACLAFTCLNFWSSKPDSAADVHTSVVEPFNGHLSPSLSSKIVPMDFDATQVGGKSDRLIPPTLESPTIARIDSAENLNQVCSRGCGM